MAVLLRLYPHPDCQCLLGQEGKRASRPFQEVMSGVVCAGSRYTEDRILVPKYYLRDRREGKGGASLGGLQPRNVWFRGCGGIWRGAGYRCTISIFCPKRHSNYTVKCSWELVLFLRLKLVRGDSYREMNTTLQFCRPVATGRKFYPPSQKFPKNPSSGGCWQHLEQKYLLGPKMYPGS